MPIYEYQCKHCAHQFERMQKLSDAAIEQCPNCMQNTVSRLISAAGFQLKGSGWYETDFKNKKTAKPSSTPDAKAQGETAPVPSGTETAASESAPAKTNETSN